MVEDRQHSRKRLLTDIVDRLRHGRLSAQRGGEHQIEIPVEVFLNLGAAIAQGIDIAGIEVVRFDLVGVSHAVLSSLTEKGNWQTRFTGSAYLKLTSREVATYAG